jgi:ferredoxin-NADP reductase
MSEMRELREPTRERRLPPRAPLPGAGAAVGARPLPPTRVGVAAPFEANAIVIGRQDLTAAVARFTIRPDGGVPPFQPGQYFALGLPVDGRVLQRPYSTATVPGAPDELEFLVRLVPAGAFTPRLWELHPGDRLRIGRPKGLFTLRPDDPRTHLFISTGTGLAPFIAMAQALRARPDGPRSIVVHGVADVAELAYRDRLERWSVEGPAMGYVPSISRPDRASNVGWVGPTGRIDAVLPTICDDHRIDPAATVAYLCGNPGMIEAVSRRLRERGLPDEAIVSEHYWTDPEASPRS